MKVFPGQGLPQCTSRDLTRPAVLKSGQRESTGSDGRSTEWVQLEMCFLELKLSNNAMRTEPQLLVPGRFKGMREWRQTQFGTADEAGT